MSEIIIQLDGGLVQDVFIKGKGKPTSAIVVDEDIEGAIKKDIVSVIIHDKDLKNFKYEAFIHSDRVIKLPKGCPVDMIVSKYKKQKKGE